MIAPWTIRNAVVMHHFVPVSDETGITLVGTYNASLGGEPARCPTSGGFFFEDPGGRRTATPRRPLHRGRAELEAQSPGPALHRATIRSRRSRSPTTTRGGCSSSRARSRGTPRRPRSACPHRASPGIGVVSFWILLPPGARRALHAAGSRGATVALGGSRPVCADVVFVNVETPRFRAPIDPFLILLGRVARGDRRRLVVDRLTPCASRGVSRRAPRLAARPGSAGRNGRAPGLSRRRRRSAATRPSTPASPSRRRRARRSRGSACRRRRAGSRRGRCRWPARAASPRACRGSPCRISRSGAVDRRADLLAAQLRPRSAGPVTRWRPRTSIDLLGLQRHRRADRDLDRLRGPRADRQLVHGAQVRA